MSLRCREESGVSRWNDETRGPEGFHPLMPRRLPLTQSPSEERTASSSITQIGLEFARRAASQISAARDEEPAARDECAGGGKCCSAFGQAFRPGSREAVFTR